MTSVGKVKKEDGEGGDSNRVWKNNNENLEELINMSQVGNPGSVNITTNTKQW